MVVSINHMALKSKMIIRLLLGQSNVYLTAKETHIIQYPINTRNLNQILP